jgi:Calcineurin-like phosphoesterase
MQFVTDPTIVNKISKMEQRVRWRDRLLLDKGIDQTALFLEDDYGEQAEFSFLVIGDSGSGYHRGHNPQRQIAEQMLGHRQDCRFVLHTGDVIYLVGSSEFYPKNFIYPYREFLVGGEKVKAIAYDKMVFNQPFLPVLGNHDYYNLPRVYGVLAQASLPLRYLFRRRVDLDIGWHGSNCGDAYARAFLDYLKRFSTSAELAEHCDRYYTAKTSHGYALRYQPNIFTRLPNRYYTFQAGGIDFFALDSNTFNAPIPLPETGEGARSRQELEARRTQLEQEQQVLMEEALKLDPSNPEEADQQDDLHAKIEQLAELVRDIDKQLTVDETTFTDDAQLEWLQQRLIASWRSQARGRILYFHHPPYVTEATKWHQAQTLAIRERLQQVLDGVAKDVGELARDRSIVDLVINGHAHCFEYLRTGDTGHADAHTNWIVCGGSGFSLRRQRQEGSDLLESFGAEQRPVATSHLFVGRSGQGSQKRRPYSFVRIDVKGGDRPKFVIRPYVAEWFQRKWHEYAIDPFEI